jgi:hypothetical protein
MAGDTNVKLIRKLRVRQAEMSAQISYMKMEEGDPASFALCNSELSQIPFDQSVKKAADCWHIWPTIAPGGPVL